MQEGTDSQVCHDLRFLIRRLERWYLLGPGTLYPYWVWPFLLSLLSGPFLFCRKVIIDTCFFRWVYKSPWLPPQSYQENHSVAITGSWITAISSKDTYSILLFYPIKFQSDNYTTHSVFTSLAYTVLAAHFPFPILGHTFPPCFH